MDKKKVIVGIIVLTLIILVIVVFGLKEKPVQDEDISKYPNIEGSENVKQEGNDKINISSKIKEEHGYANYKITNGGLVLAKGVTTFTATIRNITNKKEKGHIVEIVFLDKNGAEISKMGSYIRDLKGNETMNINASIAKDLVNAYDYKVVKK